MGVFDKVFKKEPTEEELQAKEDLMMKSSEEKYEEDAKSRESDEASSRRQPYGAADKDLVRMERDVELLKVQIELIKQAKQVSDERFTKISEQIGEIRATVLDSERDAATIKMQAEKATELISMVQPERLMQAVKKIELKLEEQQAVDEKFSAMQQKLVSELKDLRQRTEAIRGADTIMKLNEEVREELSTAMQVQGKMEQRADKVEAMFAEFQQHFYEYQKVFDRLKELDGEFKDISKEFNVFKVKIESAASKSDFLKFKNDLKEYGNQLDEKIIEVDKSIEKAGMAKEDIQNELMDKVEEGKKEILQKIATAEEAKAKIDGMRQELEKMISSESAVYKKDFDSRISKLEGWLERWQSDKKMIEEIAVEIKDLDPLKTQTDKNRKELAAMETGAGKMQDKSSELEKRLKVLESRGDEAATKVNRKLDAYVSDVQDNTAVIRDLVKEVYSIKTHSANALTRNDLSNYQKSVNEKLITFDMSLIKLEHHITDIEQALRNAQRDYLNQLKEVQRKIVKAEEEEGRKSSQAADRKDIA
ncbi:MAG: hypothetical protein V1835_06545 [Candidatus Micrarchaeota archaeon]